MKRNSFLRGLYSSVCLLTGRPANAFAPASLPPPSSTALHASKQESSVAYKPFTVTIPKGDVQVPVACWFPVDNASDLTPATYSHRISVRKIGQLLAQWNFIPEFVSKNYPLQSSNVYDGRSLEVDVHNQPLVLLAHGYLGSRFDMCHLAQRLASQGFVCIAPEYPESLAASYETNVDRATINDLLLPQWQGASAYGIVGHSLGCGTALQMDDSWTKVLVAGFAKRRDGTKVEGNMLLLTSMGDGLANRMLQQPDAIPNDMVRLNPDQLPSPLPSRAALVYDGPAAPNHISFLDDAVNDCMIQFLSPLLPLAQALSIPVLDFDKYKESRDSVATAALVHPVLEAYLLQEMKVTSKV